MRWSEEKYVKLFVRKTVTWHSWPWQSKALFPLLLASCDGAGLVETGGIDEVRAVAMITALPNEVVEAGIAGLLTTGTLVRTVDGLLMPKYLEAQESTKSDPQKKRDQRERAIAKARLPKLLESGQAMSPHVTDSHQESPPVPLQPSPAQPTTSPPPSATAEATAAKETRGHVALVVVEPTTPEAQWLGEDFWRWFQSRRQKAGFVAEKPPHPSKLSGWFSSSMQTLGGDVEALKAAVYNFGDDKFWQSKDPPLPFAGFMSQCPPKWIPRKVKPRAQG